MYISRDFFTFLFRGSKSFSIFYTRSPPPTCWVFFICLVCEYPYCLNVDRTQTNWMIGGPFLRKKVGTSIQTGNVTCILRVLYTSCVTKWPPGSEIGQWKKQVNQAIFCTNTCQWSSPICSMDKGSTYSRDFSLSSKHWRVCSGKPSATFSTDWKNILPRVCCEFCPARQLSRSLLENLIGKCTDHRNPRRIALIDTRLALSHWVCVSYFIQVHDLCRECTFIKICVFVDALSALYSEVPWGSLICVCMRP